MPPSKIKTDDDYDDRISQICQKLRAGKPVDVREITEQIASTDSVHDGNRIPPEELKRNYRLNEGLLAASSKNIAVVDDLLTTGAHFRAVKDMIVERVPAARAVGVFIARRAIPNPFEAVSIEDLLK